MITTKDIAAMCNVSRGTVDRALNGRGRISEKTRANILKICEQYNYRPDIIARSLVTQRTNTLGVVMFDLINHYFTQIINSAEYEAQIQGYGLNVMLSHTDVDMEWQVLERMQSYRVDGLLIQPIGFGEKLEGFLQSMKIPVVCVGNRLASPTSFVGIDDFRAAADGARDLLKSAYDLIVFVCPPLRFEGITNVSVQRQRLNGFLSVMESAGRPYEVWTDDILTRLDALMAAGKRAVAFCSSDRYVLRFVDHAEKMGYSIPAQLGLFGFDNVDIFQYLRPSITTIAPPLEQVGRCAIRLLSDIIHARDRPHDIILDHQIIHGQSVLY